MYWIIDICGEARKINETVAPAIKKLINERGLKQYAVAKKAGYTKQQFNNMLNGRRVISDADIYKITCALGVTPNDLFYRRDRREGGER